MSNNQLSPEALSQLYAFLQSQPGFSFPAGPSQVTVPAPSQPTTVSSALATATSTIAPAANTTATTNAVPSSQSSSTDASILQAPPLFSFPTTGAAPSTAPGASQAPAPITPYTSVNMLNAVAGGSLPASSSPPFEGRPRITTQPGFPALTLIQRTNEARLDHAAESLPTRPKARGKAKKTLSLVSQEKGRSLDDCLHVTPDKGILINLAVNVYPPRPPTDVLSAFGIPRHVVLYVRHGDSFNTVLNRLHLYHEFHEISVKMLVLDVLTCIVEELKAHGYNFEDMPTPSTFAPHESLPLQLLGFTNLGRPNGRSKSCKLATGAFNANTTLEDVLRKREYANAKLSITSRGFFELNTIIRKCHYPLSIDKSLADLSFGSDTETKTHRCISKRVYGMFRDDEDVETMAREEDLEQSCGEEEESDEEDEQAVVNTLLSRPPLTLRTPSGPAATPGSSSAQTSVNLAAVRDLNPRRVVSDPTPFSSTGTTVTSGTGFPAGTATVAEATGSSNHGNRGLSPDAPVILWAVVWDENREQDLMTIYSFERTPRFFEVVSETYGSTHSGRPPPNLFIKGRTQQELSQKLKGVIVDCLGKQDFTRLLTADRLFAVVDADDDLVSSGNGVEREVVQTLCHSYFRKGASTFFMPLAPQFSTLAAVNGASARWMSDAQKLKWGVLGAVVALALIHGFDTAPLNPLLLIYFINDCDIISLHSSLVLKWFPELHATLKAWTQLGHLDNIAGFAGHFASYHDCDISALRVRSADQHTALAWEMLHNGVIGTKTCDHPAFQSFLKGFYMPCDKGYMFTQIARSYQGGSENFVCSVYQNHISHYSDLLLEHQSRLTPVSETRLREAFHANPTLEVDDFKELFRAFLEETGYPSLDLMEELNGCFNPIVDLSDIHDDTFRMRMLCWAATGAPYIVLVEDDDAEYRAGLATHEWTRHLNAGVCKFRTCVREIRIPASFLIHLLSIDYGSGDDNSSGLKVEEAVHHWLLVAILDNIGQNNLV
ncbi:hypothetical protein PM082_023297 [Marasmius tenuissimus]|nr:hypothetical protein PM082_023297 [Marasmius tenuissimus]